MKHKIGLTLLLSSLSLVLIGQSAGLTQHQVDSILDLTSSGTCAFFTIMADLDAPTCNDFTDGSIFVNEPVDGVGPYTYQWVGGPDSQTWSGLGAGTYTIIIVDLGQMASCSEDIFLNEPSDLTVFDMNAIAPTCFGLCNGSANPIVIGGNGGNSFDWDSGEMGPSANMLCDPFTLTITDQEGCVFDTTFNFNNTPTEILIDPVITQVDCNGNDNGSIEITISGGIGPYDTDWTGPNSYNSTDEDIFNLEPGTYTVIVTDDNLCTNTASYVITQPDVLDIAFTKIDNDCFGDLLGEIDVTVTGGTTDYNYSWTGPNTFTSNSEDLTNLDVGIYDLVVTDDNGCMETLQVEILGPDELIIDEVITHITCFDDDDGAIDITVTGGTGSPDFNWVGPNTFTAVTEDIMDLEPGDYTVTVTDANNCVTQETFTIIEPDQLQLSAIPTPVTCNGDTDGSIDLTITGGTAPVGVSWVGPNSYTSLDEDIFGLEPGSYTVTATDFNNCVEVLVVVVDEPAIIVVDEVITEAGCGGQATGAIDITVNGGNDPYDFSWTGPNTFTSADEDISNLEIGTYDLTITDANNCVFNASYDIVEMQSFTVDFDVQHVDCFGLNTGSIDMTINGGALPLDINWTGPNSFSSMDEDIFFLNAGTYTVTIIDADLCQQSIDVEILENPIIDIQFDPVFPTCNGDTDGSIDATVTGGVLDYDYSWTGPSSFSSNQEDISGLAGGTYFLTVTDDLGCIQIESIDLSAPDLITIDGIIQHLVCNNDSSGSIDATINNSVDPTMITWTGPGGFMSASEDISMLIAGNYTINVSDGNGCTATESFIVTQPDTITVDETIVDVGCLGPAFSSISIDINGGTDPYDVLWTGPNAFSSMDEDISGLEAGIYDLTVTDQNGCVFQASYEVMQLPDLVLTEDITQISCFAEDNGAIDLTITGGTMPYTISWTGPNSFTSNDEDIFNLEPGTYNVTVEGAGGCIEMASFDIIEPALLELNFTIVNPTCPFDDGSIEVFPSGGTTPYDIEWSEFNGPVFSTDALIDNLAPGIYVVLVSDDNNCMAGDTISINHPTPMVTETVTPVTCPGGMDGAIELEIITSDPPVDIDWDGPNSFDSSDEDIFNLEAGIYTVDIIDQALCNVSLIIEVPTLDPIEITADVSLISCAGDNNGAIDLTVQNAVDPYTLNWIGPNSFASMDEDISSLEPGLYTVTIEDGNMCVADSTFEILDGIGLDLSFSITNSQCADFENGEIDMSINNGQMPFDISWTGPNAFSSVNEDLADLEPGSYTVVVTDFNNCSNDSTIIIIEPDSILQDILVLPSLCSNTNDGSITHLILGGVAPYDFSWTGPNGFISADQDLTNLFPGDYTLIVSDANLCIEDTIINVPSPAPLVVDLDITQPMCGVMDGEIVATVSGGTVAVDYGYEWLDAMMNNIGNSNSISALGAGFYTLIVTDDNNCSDTTEIALADNLFDVQTLIYNASCGVNDGSIELTITGGQTPLIISWTGPNGFVANDEDIFDLAPGFYELTIVDGNMCQFFAIYEVTQPEDISVVEQLTNPSCFGVDNGSIEIEISGGDGMFDISWIGPNSYTSNDEDIFDLEAGVYELTIGDMSGCIFMESYELFEPTEIEAIPLFQGPVCPGISDGFIDLTVSGGTPDYSFDWTGPNSFTANTEDISNLEAGEYTVVITDALLCQREYTYTLINATEIVLDEEVNPISCFGFNDGSILLDPSGGTSPYDFNWTGPNSYTSNDEDIYDLEPGTYTITANDQLNCIVTLELEILEPDTLDVTLDLTNPSCWYLDNGALDITVTGGTEPYSFEWTGPNTFNSDDEDISDLEEGSYTLVVLDSNMCQYSDVYTLISPTEITVILDSITSPICDTSPDGQIYITPSGGFGDLVLSWTGPNSFTSADEDPDMLISGTYNLTISDEFSCVLDTSFIVVSQNLLIADAGSFGELCDGDSINLDASNSLGATAYEWSIDGIAFSSDIIATYVTSLNPGDIVLTVDNGVCVDSDTLLLDVNALPPADAGPDQQGFIDEVFTIGGNPTTDAANSVEWSPPENLDDETAFNPIVTVITDQWYIVTVTDPIGCVSIDSVYVGLTIPVDITNTITPNGDGYNDTWGLSGSSNFPNMEVEIYNRWGELLFQSRGYAVPWDGLYEGKELPSGTYYYVIRLNDPLFPDHYDGPITIMR